MSNVLPVIHVLIWPTALVFLALLFRREIGLATGRLNRVKYCNLEVTFREDLLHAEALARSMPAPGATVVSTPEISATPPPSLPRVLLEADTSGGPILSGSMIVTTLPEDPLAKSRRKNPQPVQTPREIILAAWSELNQSLIQLAIRQGDRRTLSASSIRGSDAARFLIARGLLNTEEARLFETLSRLWTQSDQLAGASIAPNEAQRFADAAACLTERISHEG